MWFVAYYPAHVCTNVMHKYTVKFVVTWGWTCLKFLNIKNFDIS